MVKSPEDRSLTPSREARTVSNVDESSEHTSGFADVPTHIEAKARELCVAAGFNPDEKIRIDDHGGTAHLIFFQAWRSYISEAEAVFRNRALMDGTLKQLEMQLNKSKVIDATYQVVHKPSR